MKNKVNIRVNDENIRFLFKHFSTWYFVIVSNISHHDFVLMLKKKSKGLSVYQSNSKWFVVSTVEISHKCWTIVVKLHSLERRGFRYL